MIVTILDALLRASKIVAYIATFTILDAPLGAAKKIFKLLRRFNLGDKDKNKNRSVLAALLSASKIMARTKINFLLNYSETFLCHFLFLFSQQAGETGLTPHPLLLQKENPI